MKMSTARPTLNLVAGLAAFTFLYSIAVIYHGWEIRGTDQYWYAADTLTLLQGKEPVAQHVFPVQAMEPEFDGSAPFIHNNLNMYLHLPLSYVFGPVQGWVLTNLVCVLLASAITASLVARQLGRTAGIFSYLMVLLYPPLFRFSGEIMLEPTCALFVVIAFYLFVTCGKTYISWVGVALSLAAVVLCRMSYLPMLVVFPLVFLYWNRPVSLQRVLQSAGLVLIVFLTGFVAEAAFPHGMPLSFASLMTNAVPGVSDAMQFMFDLHTPELLGDYVWKKIAYGFSEQFIVDKKGVHMWPFNVVMCLAVVPLFLRLLPDTEARMSFFALGLVGIHFLTIFVHQPGARYNITAFPAVFCAAMCSGRYLSLLFARAGFSVRPLWILVGSAACVCAFASLDVIIIIKSRGSIARENEIRRVLEKELPALIPETDTVMLEMVDASDRSKQYFPSVMAIEYSLRPRRIGYVREGLKTEPLQKMVAMLNPGYLIARSESRLLEDIKVPLSLVEFPWPEELSEYRLFLMKAEKAESLVVREEY